MNQILSMNNGTGNYNNGNNNFYGNYNEPQRGGTLDTDTTVKIFAISLIVFGALMIIMGIVNLVTANRGPIVEWPKFETQQNGNDLIVVISHDKIIDKVIYKWNANGFEKTVPGTQSKNMQVKLQVPVGDNVLNLTSIDINGQESVYKEVFTGEAVEDTEKPVINLTTIGSKLNIVAKTTTDTPIAYLLYQWDGEEEVRIDAYDDAIIETNINIKKGTNKITITAVKANNISETKRQIINGELKPEIDVNRVDGKLKIKISHASGIASADITFNGRGISLSEDWFGAEHKTIEFSVPLKDGENSITIEATSVANSKDTYTGSVTN